MFTHKTFGRYIGVLKNAWVSGMAQAASVFVNLIIVRFSVEYLGPGDFGIWMAINSFVAILILSDLGVGSAMLRLSALRRATDGSYDVQPLAITAIRFLSTSALLIVVVVVAVTSTPQVQVMLGVSGSDQGNVVLNTVWLLTAVFAVNLVAQVAIPIRLGMQVGYINGLFQTAGHIGNLVCVLIAIRFGAPLPILAAAAVIGTASANAANLVSLLFSSAKFRTSLSYVPKIREVLRPSLPFFILITLGVLSYNLDNLLIARFLTVEQVSQNAVAQRLFNVPISVVSLFFVGLWAAYADAEMTRDYGWVKRAYIRALAISSTFAAIAATSLYFAFTPLAGLLTGGLVEFDGVLVLTFALWVPVTTLSGATASLMNGLNILRWQIFFAGLALVINLAASVMLVEQIGVAGPILGTLISMVLVQPLMIAKSLREIRRRHFLSENGSST